MRRYRKRYHRRYRNRRVIYRIEEETMAEVLAEEVECYGLPEFLSYDKDFQDKVHAHMKRVARNREMKRKVRSFFNNLWSVVSSCVRKQQ